MEKCEIHFDQTRRELKINKKNLTKQENTDFKTPKKGEKYFGHSLQVK